MCVMYPLWDLILFRPFLSSSPVEKWMQTLPRSLTQTRSVQTTSERGNKVMLEVIKEVASQGHTVLLDSLQKNSENILGRKFPFSFHLSVYRYT